MKNALRLVFAAYVAKCGVALLVVAFNPELFVATSKPNRPDAWPILLCFGLTLASLSLYRNKSSASARAWAWLLVIGAGWFGDVPLEAAGYEWPHVGGVHLEGLLIVPAYFTVLYVQVARLKLRETRANAVLQLVAITAPWLFFWEMRDAAYVFAAYILILAAVTTTTARLSRIST